MTKLKQISIQRFRADSAANSTTPSGFWNRLEPLLPPAGRNVSQEEIHLIHNGKVIKGPSNLFNAFFTTPNQDQSAQTIKRDDF